MPRTTFYMFLLVVACIHPLRAAAQEPAETAEALAVKVGNLVYADDRSGVCFSSGFLETVARETTIELERTLHIAPLKSDELYNFPFVVMSGEGSWELSKDEHVRLHRYLTRGGFLLASAGCSNGPWIESFYAAMKQTFPEREFEAMEMDHPAFHTLYDIDTLLLTKRKAVPGGAAMQALTIDGRLAVAFSPAGLNDTAEAGGGCCCCGGNELQNAREINANLLVYALTR